MATGSRVKRVLYTTNAAKRARLNTSLAQKPVRTMYAPSGHAPMQVRVGRYDVRHVPTDLPLSVKMRATGRGDNYINPRSMRRETTRDGFQTYKQTNRRRLSSGLMPPTLTKASFIPPGNVSPASNNSPRKLTDSDLFWIGMVGLIFFL